MSQSRCERCQARDVFFVLATVADGPPVTTGHAVVTAMSVLAVGIVNIS